MHKQKIVYDASCTCAVTFGIPYIYVCVHIVFNTRACFFLCRFKQLQEEVRECNTKIGQLSLKLRKQDDNISHLREELTMLLIELASTRVTLRTFLENVEI